MLSSVAAEYSIRWSKNVEVIGVSSSTLNSLQSAKWDQTQWQRLLSVHAEQGGLFTDVNLPAMLGVYQIEADKIRFVPQFPFSAGVKFRATFRPENLPGGSGLALTSTRQIPLAQTTSTTRVAAIHPAVEVLPENLLKFYLQFSASMSGGHIYDYIHLRDASGQPVELPFLEIDEELWNRSMDRLTLFLDPGRIKRGVKPLEEIGPSLEVGKTYTLTIDRAWRDAHGLPLKADFVKKFKIVKADREPPDPKLWRITPPKSARTVPVRLRFHEPLDHAITQRALRIIDPKGFAVAGSVELDPTDQQWSFTPDQPWKKGVYEILVPTIIEDLAGNNIGKPFDVDLEQGAKPLTNSLVRLEFKVN